MCGILKDLKPLVHYRFLTIYINTRIDKNQKEYYHYNIKIYTVFTQQENNYLKIMAITRLIFMITENTTEKELV